MSNYDYYARKYGAHRAGILGAIARHFARKDAAWADRTGHTVDGHGAIRAKGVTNPYAVAVSEFRQEKASAMAIASPDARARAVNAARVRLALNVRSVRQG